MSQTPTPTALTAFVANTRAGLKKFNSWWSIHGFSIVFYGYAACIGGLIGLLLQRYCG